MKPETLEALKASIRKWDANAEAKTPEEYTLSTDDCPLCVRFVMKDGCDSIDGCPVWWRTRQRHCRGTPYGAAYDALKRWRDSRQDGDEARAAAREEAAFLRSLLPEGEEV